MFHEDESALRVEKVILIKGNSLQKKMQCFSFLLNINQNCHKNHFENSYYLHLRILNVGLYIYLFGLPKVDLKVNLSADRVAILCGRTNILDLHGMSNSCSDLNSNASWVFPIESRKVDGRDLYEWSRRSTSHRSQSAHSPWLANIHRLYLNATNNMIRACVFWIGHDNCK